MDSINHFSSGNDDDNGAARRLRIRGPQALAAALPYLVGGPTPGTAVLALIDGEWLLRLTPQRSLPDYPAGASLEVVRHWEGEVARLLRQGLGAVDPAEDESVAVVLYLPDALGVPPAWFGESVRAGCSAEPGLVDVIAVFGDRWRSVLCDDHRCCPAAGAKILDSSDALVVCAELVGAGLAAGPAAGRTSAADGAEVAALLGAMPYPRSVGQRRSLLRTVWPWVAAMPGKLDAQQVSLLGMAADRPGVRDALLARMARVFDGHGPVWQAQDLMWREVARTLPAAWSPGPWCIAAVAAWALGDAAGALRSVDRALQAEPGHRMAELLRELVLRDVGAATWFDRVAYLDEEDCLHFDRPPAAARDDDDGAARQAG